MLSIAGRWRIAEMQTWDQDAIDLVQPGFIEFSDDGLGQLGFIAVSGELDCRNAPRGGRPGVEFSWEGNDDTSPASGRGWAALNPDGSLDGHIYFHLGDDSSFHAVPFSANPSRTAPPRTARSTPVDTVQAIEAAMGTALAPDRFISDHAGYSFVSDLEKVRERIAGIIETEPERAIALYETFIAGCYEKAEEVDDSTGSFGAFGGSLFSGWVTARQAAGADPADTVARLLAWMDSDQYGLCSGIETDIASALDDTGRTAWAAQIERLLDAGAQQSQKTALHNPAYTLRRFDMMLRAIYVAQRDVDAYLALAERAGLTVQDCQAVATILVAENMTAEALEWVERGIEIDRQVPHGSFAAHELQGLRRDLLITMGRNEEAVQSAWAEFERSPSTYSYKDLMKLVPESDRTSWHVKAIEAVVHSDLGSAVGLLVETKEIERLAEFVDGCADDQLERTSHYALEPAAKSLDQSHPGHAARLWCAMGLRIIDAGKSKYYGAALDNFERARRSFGAAGLEANWEQVVDRVRARHSRKTGFMAGLEEIVAGVEPEPVPTFLEKAKERWTPPSS